VSSVAQGYVGLRSLDAQLEVAREKLRTRQASLELFERRFERGVISELELAQVRSELERTAAGIPAIERDIARLENALSILLGRPPGPIERGLPLDELAMPPVPTTPHLSVFTVCAPAIRDFERNAPPASVAIVATPAAPRNRRRGQLDNVISASWYSQVQQGCHLAPLTGKHIVGACGSSRVHELEPDLPARHCEDKFAWREDVGGAGAQHDNFRIGIEQSGKIVFYELVDALVLPAIDDRFERQADRARMDLFADADAIGGNAADHQCRGCFAGKLQGGFPLVSRAVNPHHTKPFR